MKLRTLLAFFIPLSINHFAAAQPIDAALLRGKGQQTEIDRTFAVPFAVRVTDRASGTPLANVAVEFQNDGCVLPPEAPPDSCSLTGDPGHFAGGGGFAVVLTDANGVAVSPPYFAGHKPGIISVYAFVPPQQVDARVITLSDSVHAGTPIFGPLTQVALAIPTVSAPVIAFLSSSLGLLGLLSMRRQSA